MSVPSHRPETLLVMGHDTMRQQFGEPELARLRAVAAVGEPLVTDELVSPGARARLAGVEVLITSWGCPPLNEDVLRAGEGRRGEPRRNGTGAQSRARAFLLVR